MEATITATITDSMNTTKNTTKAMNTTKNMKDSEGSSFDLKGVKISNTRDDFMQDLNKYQDQYFEYCCIPDAANKIEEKKRAVHFKTREPLAFFEIYPRVNFKEDTIVSKTGRPISKIRMFENPYFRGRVSAFYKQHGAVAVKFMFYEGYYNDTDTEKQTMLKLRIFLRDTRNGKTAPITYKYAKPSMQSEFKFMPKEKTEKYIQSVTKPTELKGVWAQRKYPVETKDSKE